MWPRCFNSENDFKNWVKLTRHARQQVNICMDCDSAYSKEMTLQERCDADKWVTITFCEPRNVNI